MPNAFLYSITWIFFILLIAGCNQNQEKTQNEDQSSTATPIKDPHSYARPSQAVIEHLNLNAKVDFEQKQITGKASYRINNKTSADTIILDTRDLNIQKVTLGQKKERETAYDLGSKKGHMGRPLAIAIKPNTEWINIQYETSPEAAALQWLSPNQTEGGEHPYLFTQSQAILARTWIPIQDGPGIRFTYNAKMEVPKGLMALMSAENPQKKQSDGIYKFEMDQPIPAYLMALAVGDIVYEPIGGNTGVYAEKEVIEEASYEFGNLDTMVTVSEELWGPYEWEQYDLLVLPPSFPFGGMENPRLSFITPTILAGDRSLTALVAHELAHSWSGNLVTNATWNDFWINEGFTVYAEWRIMEALKGSDYDTMLRQLSYQGLVDYIEEKGADHPSTKLKLDLKGQDPDDALTPIAYDKGALLLKQIEQVFGRDRFDQFLRKHFEKHAFETMSTKGFIDYYREHLVKGDSALANDVKIEEWVYGTGLPEHAPEPQSKRLAQVTTTLEQWKKGQKEAGEFGTKNWTTHEWLHFLRQLPEELNDNQIKSLDKAYNFTNSDNSEIQALWYEIALQNDYQEAYDEVETFLINVGRRKFLTPLYEAMMNNGKEEMAKKVYEKASPNYHAIAKGTIEKVIEDT